jgi:hypothetical protein
VKYSHYRHPSSPLAAPLARYEERKAFYGAFNPEKKKKEEKSLGQGWPGVRPAPLKPFHGPLLQNIFK